MLSAEPIEPGVGSRAFGPVTVWQLPHLNGPRGEPQAREVLAATLGGLPAELPLRRDERGRPWLDGPLAHMGVSWSHSGGLLLVAMGPHMQLGVDLERLRPRPRLLEVVHRFFHPDEIAWLDGMDAPTREHWFFRMWCAKEAVLKAHGQGISFGLHRLCFGADAGGTLVLRWCDRELGLAADWQLHEWQANPEFRAAVAWLPR